MPDNAIRNLMPSENMVQVQNYQLNKKHIQIERNQATTSAYIYYIIPKNTEV
jgi:hypothetical protein